MSLSRRTDRHSCVLSACVELCSDEAKRRLVSYQTRTRGLFEFATELDAKRKQLRDVEDDLAAEATAKAEETRGASVA